MTPMRIRALLALFLMVASLAGAYLWRPTQHLADGEAKVDLETLFPKVIGEWVIDDRMPVQLVSPDTQALLTKIYSQTLSRIYVNPAGHRIMLSAAYGGDQSEATRAHRPEVCYPAQGFAMVSSVQSAVAGNGEPLRVRQLVARQGSRVEPITYWIVVGDKIVLSGTEQKLAQLSYSVRGVIPDGMLVRVSNIDGDSSKSFKLHSQFLFDLYAAMGKGDRHHVFGNTLL